MNIVTHTCREHRPISFNQSTIFFVFQDDLFAKVFELVNLVALTRVFVFNGYTSWLSVASDAPTPQTPKLTHNTSYLTPQSSQLTPHPLTPHTSHLTPHPSHQTGAKVTDRSQFQEVVTNVWKS